MDWEKCALCQTVKASEKLVFPNKKTWDVAGDGYVTMANNLTKFSELGKPFSYADRLISYLSNYRTTIPDASESTELIKCGCKTDCQTARCKCAKSELPCTQLCRCDAMCSRDG